MSPRENPVNRHLEIMSKLFEVSGGLGSAEKEFSHEKHKIHEKWPSYFLFSYILCLSWFLNEKRWNTDAHG